MRRAIFPVVLTVALLAAPAIAARDNLPWADANPLEAPARKPAKARTAEGKAPETKPAASENPAAVPIPEESPAQAGEPTPETTPVPPRAEDVAKPEPAPARPAETAVEAGRAAAEVLGDPAATATRPVTEIPVPDERPKDAPAEAPPPTLETPAGQAEPVVPPEEAPNSTEKLKVRETDVTPAASVLAAAAVEDAERCEAELTKRGVVFTVEATISEGDCGVLRPVRLQRLASGIRVAPDTQLLCRAALALDDWMTASVGPAAKAGFEDDRLAEFRHASTYVCRPRASESGISEHARGSAVDIGAFVFESGREIGVAVQAADTPEAAFLARARAGACGPFRTVLGPGTDANHAAHFHLDIAARAGGATYCR